MSRTSFLIDGFNLYHSTIAASKDLKGASIKWLNLFSLCESTLSLIDRKAEIGDVFYFSALAKHLLSSDPDIVKRHEDYIRCLESTGVNVELANFKWKKIRCTKCNSYIVRNEEKETDVAIASKLFELLHLDSCNVIVLVTGDTDLIPAVQSAKSIFPSKRILFAFPYRRKNQELVKIAPGSFRLKKERYLKHQLPDPFILENGDRIHKPRKW